MARFLENKNNIKKPAQKKKKKKQENPSAQERVNQKSYGTTKPNVKVNTTRTANTVGNTNGKYQAGSANNNTQQRYNNRPQGTATRTRNTPATAGGSQYGRAGTNARRSASEGFQRDMQARQAESRQRNQKLKEDQERRRQESEARRNKAIASRNPRMQDTARSTRLQTEEERRQRQDRLREAQRQKMGDNSMASESAQRAANRAVRNTPTVVKESLKQTAIGHGKTAADLTELNKSATIGSKIDIKSKEFQEDIEKRRKQSTRVAGKAFDELSKMQEKSEDRMQKVTGNAKGLEKAYYGALESGTGMALDRALGPAWAVSMLSRTYGNTRGQAKKEGATEAEDRAYSLLQGAKEVATEYLFQGVGLARGLSGRASLAPSEKLAKYATRNMSGRAADLAHAGIRLLGGTLEENAEEGIGWGVDPIIKEFTYKKNVRSRQAQQMMREQSDSLRSNITSPQEAQAMAAYLGSDDFLEQQTRTYMDSGIGEAEARDLAEQMRDYLDASLSGDTGRMADIEESMSNKLAGKGTKQSLKEEYSLSELMDTVASTTLLTATTGLPGAFTTASRGAAVRDQLGDDGIRALAKTAEDFEDKEMQLKAKAMSDRLASGKDITSTQAYDLAVGVQEQYNKDSDRQQAAYQTANKTIKSERLVTPYTVSRNGDIDMDEVTDKAYQTTAKNAKDIIRGYAESDESTQSLTDTEIDRGSRAIAGFQTGVFTVDDANELNFHNTAVRSAFQAETGVDLNQYVVKQKNGEIDIPATNAATKDALFAMAADNLVKSAQAETANWMDNAKGEVVTQISRRMGAKGTEALQVALDDVDERDRTKYMMTANATDMLYQAARNMGTDWESAKKYAQRMFPSISEEKLKAMYDAGLEDRIAATDNAVGLQIEIGKKAEIKAGAEKAPMGQLLIETDVPVKGTVARTFTELAKNLGVDIHLVDHFTDENGNVLKNVNGEYIDGNIYINVNSDFEKNMGFIFMHEVTHHLKKFAPEQYHELENLVRDKWFNYDAAQMQSAIAKKIETYAKHGQKLTEEQALEEIIADASHEFLTDPKFAREVADADASLAQAVLTSIRNALRALRRIMSSGNVSDDTHMNTLFSQLDILDEAERIWLSAYTQAVKNNAAVEVDRLQNQIYEEGRQSISEPSSKPSRKMSDRWENGEKLTHNQFNSWYSAHKLSYGRVARENLDEAIENIRNDGFISSTSISNVVPASINDYTDPNKPNDTQARYGAKEGDVVMFVPRPYVDLKSDIVKNGFKPREYEIVTVERDYQPYYELYEKAYDQYQENKGRYSVADMPSIDELDMTNSTVEDENGDMVAEFQENGSVRFSISSFEKSGRDIYKEYLKKQVANHNLSKEEAFGKDGNGGMLGELEAIYKISKEFADKTDENGDPIYAPFSAWSYADVVTDENGKPVFSAIKKNSEYKMNIDFSTICKKRRTLDAVFREMINRGMFERLDLNKDESAAMVVNINNLIRQHKFEAACALCFVEARRYRQQQTATTFRDMWNSLIESMYTGNNKAEYFNFGEDSTVEAVPNAIHTLDDSELDLTYIKKLATEKDDKGKLKQTAEAKAARLMLNDPSQRKLMRVGDMMASTGFENMQIKNPELMKVYNSKKGTGGAKSSFGDVQYLNEILKPRSFSRKSAYAVSGVRIQSFSDYVPRMVFDYVQVIADLAAKHLPAHGYTKEPLFVKQFGLTGTKINMSLVPDVAADSEVPGLDKDGNYLWNEEGTFPYDEAMAIQEAEGYKENCGTIAVGISDKHIMKMLADPTIQMVIPYHKSSLNPIVAAMTNVDRFKDYTESQNTKDAEGKTVAKDFDWDNKLFRLSHDSKGKMLPEEQWGDVQDLVKEYADWCKEKNYTPKFADFLYLEDGSINPGYYKLLEDFALLDNDGNFKPQGDVQMRFPTEGSAFGSMKDLIAQGLSEDTELEAKRSSEISGIVDEIEGMFDQGTLTEQSATSEKLAARMSISEDLDEPYMAAVNSGNMEEAQKYVEQAAKRAGYRTRLYHGTRSFGFTQIRTTDLESKSDGGFFEWSPFFASDSLEVAQTYSSSEDVKRISEASEPFDEEQFENEYADAVNDLVGAINGFAEVYNYMGYSVNPFASALKELQTTSHPADDIADDLIDNVSDIISELAWSRANDIVEANPDENRDVDDLADEIQEGPEAGTIWVRLDIVTDMLRSYDAAMYGAASSGNYELLTDTGNMMRVDAKGHRWNDIPFDAIPEKRGYYKTRQLAEIARDEGYVGIAISNLFDDGGHGKGKRQTKPATIYIFFNPEHQVKSADTVTYAEDGSVIPLSERFDPTNNDIRYSMSTEDADGNILTDGQMEYFKNSQARDSEGKLQTVYHTTNYGGFTIFDPSYSDDKRSLFFASNFDVSQTYGRNANKPIEFLSNEEQQLADEFPFIAGDEIEAKQKGQRGYYSCYLNLENPLIVDAKGHNWNDIPYGPEFDPNAWDDYIENLQEKYDKAVSSVSVMQEDFDDDGNPSTIWIEIGLLEKDADGNWIEDVYTDQVSINLEDYMEDGVVNAADASYALWDVASDSLLKAGLPKEYINMLTAEEITFDGDIDYTAPDWDYIDAANNTYEKTSDWEEPDTSTYRTRELAEMAEDMGHDGVIIRNCRDIGGASRLKVGASSMSDIFIAFSSNQVKDTRNENPTENPDIRYSVTEDEAMTYAAENAKTTDDLWYTDPEMESDRVRVANSKMAYIESRITKWNERWLTEGQVLDEKSVKSNIRNLIRGVMANSDTDYQYKTEMVDNALKAAKKAFYLRKVGKYSEAADLLFDTAQEIYQDNKFYGEDADFQGYKELRDFIRKTKFYVPEDQWKDIDMEAFRRNNFGSILLGSDGVAVDTIWEHMNSRWPEWFSMEVTHPADMMLSIEYALEKAKPIARAYASEEAMSLAAELADDLDTIISEGKEYVSIADTYKKKYDDKTKQMKQRHNEAMRKYRENLQDKYKKRFSEWKKDYKEKQKNKADHRKLFEGIKDDYDWLSKAVLDPTKTKYIPEAFRASLAQLLMQMDLETARSKQLEKKYGRVTSNTLKLRELRDRLNDLATAKAGDDSNLFDIDSYLPYLMDALAEKYDGQPISAMDVDSLKTMKILFKALRKNFTNLNREAEESKANVATKKATQIVLESNARIDRDGMAKKYEGLRDYMQTINMTSLTPPYFFERMGTVNDLYKELRGGFDTYVRNEAYIMDRLKGILSSYYNKPKGRHPRPGSELEAWRDSRTAKTLELTNGTITMTAAQRMALYCLTNRKQAMDHMLAGGIVVTPYEAASKIEAAKQGIKGKTEFGERLILSHADTELIKASLTPEQIKMANELQKLMSEDMARLGNEAHREMYGYEIFGEPNYFPIKSKDTWVPKDVNNMTDAVEKIKSFGPSKPLVVNASNAIVVDDIFSVVADHCNGMNLYNAYLVPISNFMRVYNTTVTLEDGTRRPVRDALEQAYGKKAMQYIDNFIRDLNGIKDRNRGGLEDIMNKAIGTAKATAVAGNLRVAAQQPTAYVRAAAEIEWKYLAPFVYVRPEKGVMDEMFEYCPIAQWKAWGYYDTYMGRDIEDVMMNNWSIRDEVLSGVYGKLDNMTWAGVWQAVKAEQKAKHPEMDHKSREFLEICGSRASEVFDKTQVVDSTFHRSDAMRNKQVAVKLFTAFMSEPTLTLNVLRAAVYNYQELMKSGHKGAALKVLGKAVSVLLVQAAFVSVAQALADAWRGKEPGFPWDDDDEEGESTYFSRFLQNLFHNFIEQLHLENNLYLVKDVKPYADFMMSKAMEHAGLNPFIRTLMGWDQEYLYNQNNLVFAGLENTATGVSQLFKKLEKGEDYDKTKYEIIQKIASGIGTFTGLPVGTLMRDFKPIFDKLFTAVNAADTLELPSTTKTESKSDGASEKTEDSGEKKSIFGFHIKSAEEKAADKEEEEINKKIQDIKSKTEGLSQEEKNQKIYSMVTRYMKDHQDGKPMADYIAAGDYWSIGDIGNMYIRAGGDGEYFKEKVFRASKSAMKKTISADNNESQKAAQARIKDYLLTNGMTEQELSDIAYKSYTKKDLQVAFRINDEDAIITEMRALMEAGMTREDIYKAYDNRNRVDLVKYKDAGGKYADRLKSMGTYIWPCNGTITSHFGHRHSPGNGVGSTNHQGLDIGASMGAPVTAADGGTVVMAKWYSGYGKTVQIQHDDGTITQYSHLSWWEPKVGDVVAQGQEIGKVGSTGNSTGPHLHFGVMKDGHYVDPEDYLNGKS